MAYQLRDGMIFSELLEVHVADQCNLSCRGCSHLSPVARRAFVDIAAMRRDLATLRGCYHAGTLRLLGGEPFLHPALSQVARVARDSKIADRVRVVTNGLLLRHGDDHFWSTVDEVEINQYPGHLLSAADRALVTELQARHGITIEVNAYISFRESYSEIGTGDAALVRRIYDTCQIAHGWGCHNVRDGYFYKCPQAFILAHPRERTIDGIAISTDGGLAERLAVYLASAEPLNACRRCLGSAGRLFEHVQTPRRAWRRPQHARLEELIDWDMLARLEQDPDLDNDCRQENVLGAAETSRA